MESIRLGIGQRRSILMLYEITVLFFLGGIMKFARRQLD